MYGPQLKEIVWYEFKVYYVWCRKFPSIIFKLPESLDTYHSLQQNVFVL